ncbi:MULTISPECIES: hypothetical protein [Vibrio harveyi group]|uniref:hypothetical protein n=1 Tax=Vibrio harveyi group TaxID=717610 RepID=UPI000423654E|nr:hypothetical protein [Vibrio parahaemolyticus]MCX8764214.1 hypothetical protein [Vibrio parahaemolyticus]
MSFVIDINKFQKEQEIEKALRQDFESELPSKVLDSLCREFIGWINSGDTDYLDTAVSLLCANNVPVKGMVLDEVGKLAEARLSREIKESSGKREERFRNLRETVIEYEPFKSFFDNLKSKSGRNKVFNSEPAISNVFDLVKICGFYELSAFFYAACINEKASGNRTFKRIGAGRVRQLYREYKKTEEYNQLISNLEVYKEVKYPNMTNEDIEHSITQGEDFCKQTYDYLLEEGKDFIRIKRNKN